MFSKSQEFLSKGDILVLDATFYQEKLREGALSMSNNPFLIEVTCPEEIVKKRLENRTNDYSDEDYEICLKCKPSFEKIKRDHFVFDSSKDFDKEVQRLLNYLNKDKQAV